MKYFTLGLFVLLATTFACQKKTDDTVTLNYLSMWNPGEPEMLFLEEAFKGFEETSGIKVEPVWAGRDSLNKLRPLLLSGEIPDLMSHGFNEMAVLLEPEMQLQSLDDLYAAAGPENQANLLNILDAKMIDLYSHKGRRYFLPLKSVTSGFFYDKTQFQAYGISAPQTWSEFIRVNQSLKDQDLPPLTLDGNIAFYNAYYYYWAVERVMGQGALHRAVADTTGETWLEPGYLEAARMVYALSQSEMDFFQPGYSGSNFPAGQANWALNKSGSILVGSWIGSETAKQKTAGFDLGFYPFPIVEGGMGTKRDVEIALFGFALLKDAPHPEEAKQFLKYFLQKDLQEKFVAITDNFSPRTDVDYPSLLKDLENYLSKAGQYHRPYDGVRADYPEWFATVFYTLDDGLVFGSMSPEEFITSMKKDSIAFWKRKNR